MADKDNRGGNQAGNRSGGSSERGFAAMDEEKQREIARKGGEASAEKQRRDDEGQLAGTSGRGGGSSERGFAAMDDEKQREIARKGGQASGQSRSGSNR